ncbi:Transformer-2 protein-like protein, partial [Zancudomyces culisetae]
MPTPVMQSEPLSVEPDLMMGANPADAEQFLSEGEQERGSKSPTQKNDIENGNGEDKNMGDAYEERERPAAESSGWEKSPRENNGYNSSWQEPGESEERSRYRDEQGDAAGWGGEIDVKGTAPEQRGVEASERFTPGEGYINCNSKSFWQQFILLDNPEPTNILGVFGLSLYTTEENLMDLFSKYGKVEKVTLVYDKEEPKRSRGFGFVTMDGVESATKARNGTNGTTVEGRSIRVDYSITRRAHSPNPTSTGYTYDPSRRHNDRDRDRP